MVANIKASMVREYEIENYIALLDQIGRESGFLLGVSNRIVVPILSVAGVMKLKAYVQDARMISRKGGFENSFEQTDSYLIYKQLINTNW